MTLCKRKRCNTSTHPSRVYINQIWKNFFPKTSLEGLATWSKKAKIHQNRRGGRMTVVWSFNSFHVLEKNLNLRTVLFKKWDDRDLSWPTWLRAWYRYLLLLTKAWIIRQYCCRYISWWKMYCRESDQDLITLNKATSPLLLFSSLTSLAGLSGLTLVRSPLPLPLPLEPPPTPSPFPIHPLFMILIWFSAIHFPSWNIAATVLANNSGFLQASYLLV